MMGDENTPGMVTPRCLPSGMLPWTAAHLLLLQVKLLPIPSEVCRLLGRAYQSLTKSDAFTWATL